MKKIVLLLLLAPFSLVSCAAPTPATSLTATRFMLNTDVTVTLYDKPEQVMLDGCFELCRELEAKLSRTMPGSDVYRLNHADGQPVTLSEEAAEVLSMGLRYGELTGGLFDVTIAPVSQLWDFGGESPALPALDALALACARVGRERVRLDGLTATLEPGMAVDLGGIAKGYVADRMAAWLAEQGVRSAILDLGGNIYALGEKPGGGPFKIGVQKPFGPSGSDYAGIFELRDGTAVTSGIYERCFTLDGTLYHHILDPRTGYPAQNELASVTIIAQNSMEADALATSCYLLGAEGGMALARARGVDAVFLFRDGRVETTEGFELLPP